MKKILFFFAVATLLYGGVNAQAITQYPYHMGFEFFGADSDYYKHGWDVYKSSTSTTRWFIDTSLFASHDGASSMYISTFDIFSENMVETGKIDAGVYTANFVIPEDLDAIKFSWWMQLRNYDTIELGGTFDLMIGKNSTDFNYLYRIDVSNLKFNEWFEFSLENYDLWGEAPFAIEEGDTIYFMLNLTKSADEKGRYILLIDDFSATATFCGETQYPYHESFESLANCWETEAWGIENGGVDGYVQAASWPNLYGTRLNREHGLYSPAIHLPAASSLSQGQTIKLTFYMASYRASNGSADINEDYAVYVTTDPSNYGSAKLSGTLHVADSAYKQFTLDLTQYAGQTIYLEFSHKTGDNGALLLDDIRIQTYNANGTAGINGIDNSLISVFPNPTRNMVSVSGVAVNRLQVLDMAGRVLSTADHANTIDMSHLSNGVYLLRVFANEGVSVRKVIKK
ncbi:MAG: T9SS type A sorting domain-containing protein [Bacteroidales bacterium]|nr:T9SS type A sorting domain-containing protein [Bacteroidales bacterium]